MSSFLTLHVFPV